MGLAEVKEPPTAETDCIVILPLSISKHLTILQLVTQLWLILKRTKINLLAHSQLGPQQICATLSKPGACKPDSRSYIRHSYTGRVLLINLSLQKIKDIFIYKIALPIYKITFLFQLQRISQLHSLRATFLIS